METASVTPLNKWIWLAGVLDSSATIAVYKHNTTYDYDWRPTIAIRRKDKSILELIAKNFDVRSLFQSKQGYFVLMIQSLNDIKKVLEQTLPYMQNAEQKRKAELLLEFVNIRLRSSRLFHSKREHEIYKLLKKPKASKTTVLKEHISVTQNAK